MKNLTFTQTLRDAINGFEMGHNELSRRSHVPQPMITRFANGKDIRLATADRLAAVLGIFVTRRKAAK